MPLFGNAVVDDHPKAGPMKDPNFRPFAGFKVLDLSQGIAGPYCAMQLGLQGAYVSKVEPPEGDWGRSVGNTREGLNGVAIACNHGKKSLCIDAAKPEGREALRRMALASDVVVDNFRAGVMERLGLGQESLMRENPKLVFATVTGFGDHGPYHKRAATDGIIQSVSGLMMLNGQPEGKPRRVNLFVVDLTTGIYASQLVSAAIVQMLRTGKGQRVTISLLEAITALQSIAIIDGQLAQGPEMRARTAPVGEFDTSDGIITLASLNDKGFNAVCRALGREDWLHEPRYATQKLRLDHVRELNAGVASVLRTNTTAHWDSVLANNDVLFAPVLDHTKLRANVHAAAIGLFGNPALERLPDLEMPYPPGAHDLPPSPRCGDHDREVLAAYGFNEAEISHMISGGALPCLTSA